jgi:hypothetical protein
MGIESANLVAKLVPKAKDVALGAAKPDADICAFATHHI